jgi:hypothetical protein
MNVNQTKGRPNFLRLVDSKSIPDPIEHGTFVRPEWRTTLFANENPSLLLFINFEEISEGDFRTVLSGARPKVLFDLRRVPRFDLGSLNRKQAFSLFSKAGTRYFDLSRRPNVDAPIDTDPGLDAHLIANASNQAFVGGPAAFLVDAQQFDEANISRLVEALPFNKAAPWDVLRVPLPGATPLKDTPSRTLVFISHANPEDNAFATWLAGQLALAGYAVWSDVTQLVGGEIFWDDIEATIRSRAAKVIAVLSVAAQRKPGLLDELDLAIRVERSYDLTRFILPLRLDNLSFSDVRANIGRRNIIDFRENWASGLHSILDALERDKVPRTIGGNAEALSRWVTDRVARLSSLVAVPERLTSNWLPIASLPNHVLLHEVSAPAERIASIVGNLRLPTFRYLRLVGSFGEAQDLQLNVSPGVTFTEAHRIKLEDLLQGTPNDLPGLPRWEANKIVINLLRQAWNLHMERRGLRSFEMASGHLAWYLPKGFLEGNRIEFQGDDGKKRRKSLVGWSARRNVFWHFAVEARPVLGEYPHFVLRSHVIFTPDGILPIESKERMHMLRRRFCRSWWNDRWRDLLIGLVTWLNGRDGCALAVGANSSIKLERRLMSVMSPMSVARDEDLQAASVEFDDELDSGDDFDTFEELDEARLEGEDTTRT